MLRSQRPDLLGHQLHSWTILVGKRLLLVSILSASSLIPCPAFHLPARHRWSEPGHISSIPSSFPFSWLNRPHFTASPRRARPPAPPPWCFPSLLPVCGCPPLRLQHPSPDTRYWGAVPGAQLERCKWHPRLSSHPQGLTHRGQSGGTGMIYPW